MGSWYPTCACSYTSNQTSTSVIVSNNGNPALQKEFGYKACSHSENRSSLPDALRSGFVNV